MRCSRGVAHGAAVAALVMAIGCGRSLNYGKNPPGGGGGSGSNGNLDGGIGADGGTGSGADGGGGATACSGPEAPLGKRLVRLNFHQVAASIRALLGDAVAEHVGRNFEIDDRPRLAFPPLSDARDGALIDQDAWNTGDQIAQLASASVLDDFAAITACGDTPTEECGRKYVLDLAARAYRRPLTGDETTSLVQVYDDTRGLLGNVKEAVQSGVYAVLDAPQFLYRTEFGGDSFRDGPLAPLELASALAYFLTDAPPDGPLRDAASSGQLASNDQISAQVNRLLATDGARRNLERAMLSYLGQPALDLVVIDTAAIPIWSTALRESMKGEAARFLADTLWDGALGDLLTSRRSRIDSNLAALYGVAFPPAGVTLDTDGFAPVQLAENRAGLLTQAGWLTARARPNMGSIVARGEAIRSLFVCAPNITWDSTIDMAPPPLTNATATKAANQRISSAACHDCHAEIDPYGIALESFDLLGRFREFDEAGWPIDASTVLPAVTGGAGVTGAGALAAALVKDGRLTACLAQNLLIYALAESVAPTDNSGGTAPLAPGSCANRAVVSAMAPGQPRFAELIRAIAVSPAILQRHVSAGGGP